MDSELHRPFFLFPIQQGAEELLLAIPLAPFLPERGKD